MEKKSKLKKVRKKLKISDIKRGPGADVGHMLSRIKAREKQLTFCCVTICLLAVLVSAYFIFSAVRKHQSYNTLRVGSFEVVFADKKDSLGDVVNFTNPTPLSDIEAGDGDAYIVTIRNTSSKEKNFQLELVHDEAMIESDGCSNQLFDSSYLKYQINGKNIQEVLSFEDSFPLLITTLKPKEEKTYQVRIWVRDDVFIDERNSHYHDKLVITTKKDL